MKAKLESDGKIWSGPLILRWQLNAVSGIAMLDMITPNSAKPKCRADAVVVLITWTSSSWRCCSSFGINLDLSHLLQESVAKSILINQTGIRSPLIFNTKEQIFASLGREPFNWWNKQKGSDFPEQASPIKLIYPPGSFTWINFSKPRYGVIEPPWTGWNILPS